MKIRCLTKEGDPILVEVEREPDYKDKYLQPNGKPFEAVVEDLVKEKAEDLDYVCEECGKEYKTETGYKNHIKKHS